ncbi:MAG: aminodeoxychorismate/anthranilate synthase component II [Eubacterium sp.]|nr:aminodeoxychorismate/anthranilate synthase component II [Eubacterium sp.]
MVLLIDNYDSFSYNLFQLVGEIEPDIKVIRNDELSVEEIEALKPACIILSPGPGKPKDAGVCEEVVEKLGAKIPIMGVCLGHQSICEVFGATVTYASRLMHGKQSVCSVKKDDPIFEGIKGCNSDGAELKDGDSGSDLKVAVARYHSLSAKKETLPDELEVIAVSDDDGEIMAVKHKSYPIYGLQFHPESILTPEGKTILSNFIGMRII